MVSLRPRLEKQSKLVRLERLGTKAKKFELFDTAYRLSEIENRLVELNHAENRKAKIEDAMEAVDQAKITLEREHNDRKIEKSVKFRSRRGLATVSVLFGCMAAVGHMLYNPPAFIRSLPPKIGDNFHLFATAVILALAAIPVRDFAFTMRFNNVKIEGEKLLIKLKKELEEDLKRN